MPVNASSANQTSHPFAFGLLTLNANYTEPIAIPTSSTVLSLNQCAPNGGGYINLTDANF